MNEIARHIMLFSKPNFLNIRKMRKVEKNLLTQVKITNFIVMLFVGHDCTAAKMIPKQK